MDSRLPDAVDVAQDPQHPLPDRGRHHRRPADGALGLRRTDGKGGRGGVVVRLFAAAAGVLREDLIATGRGETGFFEFTVHQQR